MTETLNIITLFTLRYNLLSLLIAHVSAISKPVEHNYDDSCFINGQFDQDMNNLRKT